MNRLAASAGRLRSGPSEAAAATLIRITDEIRMFLTAIPSQRRTAQVSCPAFCPSVGRHVPCVQCLRRRFFDDDRYSIATTEILSITGPHDSSVFMVE